MRAIARVWPCDGVSLVQGCADYQVIQGARLPRHCLYSFLKPLVVYPILSALKQHRHSLEVIEGECAQSSLCPLSCIDEGTTVCIKRLSTNPEMSGRLRELGIIEHRKIKLLTRDSSLICQVCNARLGISEKLAEAILVEAVPVHPGRP